MKINQLIKHMFNGNPYASAPEKKVVESTGNIPPLSNMIKDLLGLSDEEWGLYAFRREPLKSKISLDERIVLTKECIQCGQEHARDFIKQFGRASSDQHAEKLGLDVIFEDRPNDGGFVIFAQYRPPKKILVFNECLRKAEVTLKANPDILHFSKDDIQNVLIAHELFHYVEQSTPNIYTKSKKLELWSFGPFSNKSPISCLSEIAGMAFAKELTGISYSPYLFDLFLVYGYNPPAAYELYKGIVDEC